MNTSPNASTRYSPAYVVFGRNPTFPLEAAVRKVVDCKVPSVSERIRAMADVVKQVQDAMTSSANKMAERVN